MKCPNCSSTLTTATLKGIEVDRCPNCQGTWLDFQELDALEDTVFNKDEQKGSVILRTDPGTMRCPKCDKQMKKFRYRLYDLELDFCEDHGFWLDKGEETRVVSIMKEEVKKTAREFDLEDQWSKTLRMLKSKSFKAKLWDLFH
jgi:Zn-finger nucleic acid-binding protein